MQEAEPRRQCVPRQSPERATKFVTICLFLARYHFSSPKGGNDCQYPYVIYAANSDVCGSEMSGVERTLKARRCQTNNRGRSTRCRLALGFASSLVRGGLVHRSTQLPFQLHGRLCKSLGSPRGINARLELGTRLLFRRETAPRVLSLPPLLPRL